MPDPLKGRVFTQEEVNTILSRAVERQNPGVGGLTYAELVDSARQAGIDPSAIAAAVEDLDVVQESSVEDDLVNAEVARRRWRAWRGFSIHFTVYVMFSVLIAFINIHELNQHPNGELFFPIPILAWGIGIAAHFMAVFFPTVFPNPDRAEGIRRELRRREEKVRRREKRDEKRDRRIQDNGELKESAKELGVAVQRGMATLLSDVAKTIHEEVDRASRVSDANRPGVRVGTRPRVGQQDPPGGRSGRPYDDDGADDDDQAKRAAKRR